MLSLSEMPGYAVSVHVFSQRYAEVQSLIVLLVAVFAVWRLAAFCGRSNLHATEARAAGTKQLHIPSKTKESYLSLLPYVYTLNVFVYSWLMTLYLCACVCVYACVYTVSLHPVM